MEPVTPADPSTEPPVASAGRSRVAGLGGTGPGRALTRLGRAVGDALQQPMVVLALVLLAAFGARAIFLEFPRSGGLIFDEAFYINAARRILGWAVAEGAHYADRPAFLDPNTEHPPLGKVLIAGSMSVFGDNGFAWRLPSVIAGMVSLVAMFLIVRSSGGSEWLAVLVVGLLAFDNMTLVHGRIGTLDILALAPMLIASLLAVRGRWLLAGVFLGIALLIKITAIYALGAILLLYLFRAVPRWLRRRRIRPGELVGPAVFVVATAVVALGGLWFLDAQYTTFETPFDHIKRIWDYGANLATKASAGFCPGADSRPIQWLFNECQIQYMRVDVNVRAGEELVRTVPRIDFRGAMNPLLVGAIPLSMLFLGWYASKTRNRVALWAVAWAAANYLPYVFLALLTTRIMYIYYMLPVIPALAVALAILLLRAGLPRPVRYGFLVLYAIGFAAYFPFRQLP